MVTVPGKTTWFIAKRSPLPDHLDLLFADGQYFITDQTDLLSTLDSASPPRRILAFGNQDELNEIAKALSQTKISPDTPRLAILAEKSDAPGEVSAYFHDRLSWEASRETIESGFNIVTDQLMEGRETVLIIDDEADILEVLSGALSDEGYRVETRSDGSEAIDFIKRRSPALIISDIYMGNMNGFLLLQKAKQLKPDIPVILMSGHYPEKLIEMGQQVQASGTIEKPFRINKVIELVKSLTRPADS